MISAGKMQDGLKSIQSLIAQARHDAYEAGAKNVGDLLDDMELLPEMLGSKRDQSREFRDVLEGLAEKHPQCRYIVDEFLERPTGKSRS